METLREELIYGLSGGQVETGDWMAGVPVAVAAHREHELGMGVLPERDWILRAPMPRRGSSRSPRRSRTVGHAQSSTASSKTSVSCSACLDDLVSARRESSTTSSTTSTRTCGATSASSASGSSTPPADRLQEGTPQVPVRSKRA